MDAADPCPAADGVVRAQHAVPDRLYTHHPRRGTTIHRSNPASIARELSTLDVPPGARVLEIGTGSGYSGALLAELVGTAGHVVSLDIDPTLTVRAKAIHAEHGVTGVECHTADGMAGWPPGGPYERIIAWAMPPVLPRCWVEQLAPGGIIVVPLPVAPVPQAGAVARIRLDAGRQPSVDHLVHGGYTDMLPAPRDDQAVPGRWIDCRIPGIGWAAVAWRSADTPPDSYTTVLDRLTLPGHAEPYRPGIGDRWYELVSWLAALAGHHLTVAGLGTEIAVGWSDPHHVAVLRSDDVLLADAPDSPALAELAGLLDWWRHAGPAGGHLGAVLVAVGPDAGTTAGWRLQLTYHGGRRT